MGAPSQGGINFSDLMSGYDLMESANKHWMEAIGRIFPGSSEKGEKNHVPGTDAFRSWPQWHGNTFNKKDLRLPDLQAAATACIEQQKRCSELGQAWWKCYIKTSRAIGSGMRNGDHPAQIMKACLALSEEYVRCFAAFLATQSEALSRYDASLPPAPETGPEKAKPAKVKAS